MCATTPILSQINEYNTKKAMSNQWVQYHQGYLYMRTHPPYNLSINVVINN
jgi:hypothetical protein